MTTDTGKANVMRRPDSLHAKHMAKLDRIAAYKNDLRAKSMSMTLPERAARVAALQDRANRKSDYFRERSLKPKGYLYRHFDSRWTLLYVGQTANSLIRQANHFQHSLWGHLICTIVAEPFETIKQATRAERLAIWTEAPIHNIHGNEPRTVKGNYDTILHTPQGIIDLDKCAFFRRTARGTRFTMFDKTVIDTTLDYRTPALMNARV